jgi:phage shock protein PspC (stress-responsive transcriptional regulator)
MEPADVSSQEKLDQMLRDGKITEEDYLLLSKALAKKPGPWDEKDLKATGRRKLHKSWKQRQIGGVCGGIADYFETDPMIVRVLAIVLAFMAAPVALVVYFWMYFTLPWDDEEADKEVERRGGAKWYAQLSILFSTLSAKTPHPAGCSRSLPWQVWLFIGVLAVTGLVQFSIFVGEKPLVAFTILVINTLLAYGLFHKKRWAFLLSLFFCFVSIVLILKNPIVSLLNVALGVILLTAYPHFFVGEQDTSMSEKEF